MSEPPDPVCADGEADDQALMTAYAAGDGAAFDALYVRYKGPVYRFFLRQLERGEAEECHQETWLKLIKARDRYRPSGAFVGYLFTIAHRVLADRHRANMRRPATGDASEPDAMASESNPDHAEWLDEQRAYRHLCTLLVALPIAQREAWIMHQETGMTLDQIAEITSTSREGVKSRVRYATRKLRDGMQAHVRTT